MKFKIIIIFLMVLLQSCLFSSRLIIKGNGNINLEEVKFEDLDNWLNADHKKATESFSHSCDKFAKISQSRFIGGQIGNFVVSDFRDVCDMADVVKGMDSNQARKFFENWFVPFLVTNKNGDSKGLFTGYYEASLNGSLKRDDKYKYPVYRKPDDLGFEPYFSRYEIESGGALSDKNLEILYVDDPIELFFLHIQGSGRVEMKDGSNVRLSYAGRNNQPYTSIGAYMVDHGMISGDDVNAESIKDWLRDNPDQAQDVMNQNASYTFFDISDNEYVVGAQNVPLTPLHSIAIDNDIIPYGLPIWLESYVDDGNNKEKFNQLLVSQDTGTAIKGTVRGDIFFGYGKDAEKKASYMASKGQYFILLPANVVDKLTE